MIRTKGEAGTGDVIEAVRHMRQIMKEIADLKKRYEAGTVGDVEVKERLVDALDTFLDPIRERRAEYAKDPKRVMQILKDGTAHAREIAAQTLASVKRAMKINYW